MGTLVCFHAHPDDEAISTGGSIARAAAEGHRVILVVATHGEWGESPEDLGPGETLVDRRRAETVQSAAVLGIHRVVWLGYEDSGMTGWEQNANPASFLRAPVEEAAGRLADVLREEHADVLTVYDWHGNYGHPDHVKVYQVGCRAEQMVAAELPHLRVFEATMNRDEIRRQMEIARASGQQFEPDVEDGEFDPDGPMDDGNPMGMAEAEITLAVDVSPYVFLKRDAVKAHRSQVTDSGFFTRMTPATFAHAFGREWYIEHGRQPGLQPGWLFDDV